MTADQPPAQRAPLYSTSLTSNEAYAQAEYAAHTCREFESQARRDVPLLVVRDLSLREAIGEEYLRHVAGRVRSDPQSQRTDDVDFSDGRVLAWYHKRSDGYGLLTMYPAPARRSRTRLSPEVERFLAGVWDTDVRGDLPRSRALEHLRLLGLELSVSRGLHELWLGVAAAPADWRELLNVQTWTAEQVADDVQALWHWLFGSWIAGLPS